LGAGGGGTYPQYQGLFGYDIGGDLLKPLRIVTVGDEDQATGGDIDPRPVDGEALMTVGKAIGEVTQARTGCKGHGDENRRIWIALPALAAVASVTHGHLF